MSLRSFATPLLIAGLLIAGLALSPRTATADGAASPPDAGMRLFLLVGQSNMAGRGVVAEEDRSPLPRVWSMDARDAWVPAVDPIHFDKPKVAGVGLGRTFGRIVADALPGTHVGLIPCAVGGTSIDQWRPGGTLHAEAVRRAKLAKARGTLAGILWHQGESNSSDKSMPGYPEKLSAVMDAFRAELDAADVPVVVGKLGLFRLEKSPGTAAFNAMIARYAADHPHTACVEADGLTSVGDDTHFDAASQRELGKRYAAAYLTLAKRDAPATRAAVRSQMVKVRGTVVAIDEAQITIRTADGQTRAVPLGARAQYRRVSDALKFASTTRGEIRPGDWVMVSLETADPASAAKSVWLAKDDAAIVEAFRLQNAAAARATTGPTSLPSVGIGGGPTVPATKANPAALARFIRLHNEYVERARRGDIDLMFVGDSITEGWKKAPDLWAERYAPLRAVNFGISGDRVQNVLWRLQNGELDGATPKVIVLMIGTNNSNNDAPGPIVEGVKLVLATIRERSPDAKVLLMAIFPRDKPTDAVQMPTIAAANALLATLDDGDRVRYLDVNAKFLTPDGVVNPALFPDALHPGPAGYQVWSDAMHPLLLEMMK